MSIKTTFVAKAAQSRAFNLPLLLDRQGGLPDMGLIDLTVP
jgi:hypothetical protein